MSYERYLARYRKLGGERPRLDRKRYSELASRQFRYGVARTSGQGDDGEAALVEAASAYLLCETDASPFVDDTGARSVVLEFLFWLGDDMEIWRAKALGISMRYLNQFADEFARCPVPELHEREIAFFAFLWHPLHAGRKTSATWLAEALRETYRFYKAKGFAVSFPTGITRNAVGQRYRDFRAVVLQPSERQSAFLDWAHRWPHGIGDRMLIGGPSPRTPDPRTTDNSCLDKWLSEIEAIPADRREPLPQLDHTALTDRAPIDLSGITSLEDVVRMVHKAGLAAYEKLGIDPYEDDDTGVQREIDRRLLGEDE